MKKRILAILLCACMAMTGFVRAFAESDMSGDANGDGTVTPADASFVLRYIVGYDYWSMSTRNKMLADVNHDGRMDAQDASIILRHVVRLDLLLSITTDAGLLENLNKQCTLYDDELTEWTAQFIQSLPADSNVRKVLYAAAKYIGTPYATLDCSGYLKAAFADAKIPTSLYPRSSSQGTIEWYTDPKYPSRMQYFHETDDSSWQDWKPGCVLIYVNADTGKGSHLALYVGEIDGRPIVMESRGRTSAINGVRIGYLMGSSTSWDLRYYVDPLG